MTTTPTTNAGAAHGDANPEAKPAIPGGFDPALIQRMIDQGIFL